MLVLVPRLPFWFEYSGTGMGRLWSSRHIQTVSMLVFSAAVANNPRLDGFSHHSKRSEVWALGASRIGSPESLRENPSQSWLLASGSWQPSWYFLARRHINLLCHHLVCVSCCPLSLGTLSTVSCPPPLAIQLGVCLNSPSSCLYLSSTGILLLCLASLVCLSGLVSCCCG